MPCNECANKNNEVIDMPRFTPICIIFWLSTLVIIGFFWGIGFSTAMNIFRKGG